MDSQASPPRQWWRRLRLMAAIILASILTSRLYQYQQCKGGRQQCTREGASERDTTRARPRTAPEWGQATGLTEKRGRSEVRRQVGVLLGAERRDTEDGEQNDIWRSYDEQAVPISTVQGRPTATHPRGYAGGRHHVCAARGDSVGMSVNNNQRWCKNEKGSPLKRTTSPTSTDPRTPKRDNADTEDQRENAPAATTSGPQRKEAPRGSIRRGGQKLQIKHLGSY